MEVSTNSGVVKLYDAEITSSPSYFTLTSSFVFLYLSIIMMTILVSTLPFPWEIVRTTLSKYEAFIDLNSTTVLGLILLLAATTSVLIKKVVFPYSVLRINSESIFLGDGAEHNLKLGMANINDIRTSTVWYLFLKRNWFALNYYQTIEYAKITFEFKDGKTYNFLSEGYHIDALSNIKRSQNLLTYQISKDSRFYKPATMFLRLFFAVLLVGIIRALFF